MHWSHVKDIFTTALECYTDWFTGLHLSNKNHSSSVLIFLDIFFFPRFDCWQFGLLQTWKYFNHPTLKDSWKTLEGPGRLLWGHWRPLRALEDTEGFQGPGRPWETLRGVLEGPGRLSEQNCDKHKRGAEWPFRRLDFRFDIIFLSLLCWRSHYIRNYDCTSYQRLWMMRALVPLSPHFQTSLVPHR